MFFFGKCKIDYHYDLNFNFNLCLGFENDKNVVKCECTIVKAI